MALRRCTNGVRAGDVVSAEHAKLHVKNGGRSSSITARITLAQIEPCASADAGVDASTDGGGGVADGGGDAAIDTGMKDASVDASIPCNPEECVPSSACAVAECTRGVQSPHALR